MSGSISQPMAAGPGQGAAPGGMPPQLLAMLLAATRGQQGGPAQAQSTGPMQPQMGGPAQSPMPQMPGPQANSVPQVPGTADRGVSAYLPGTADKGGVPLPMPGSYMGSATPSAPPPPSMPTVMGGAAGAQQVPMAAGQQPAMSRMLNQMGQMGRHGDTMMAHMTPGEIAVPPQVQTPNVLSALQQAFKSAGADVRQFAAGSPFAAHNPNTGQQEFSLWSAILPVLGAVGGSLVGGPIGAAAGGALGGGAGGAIDHTGAAGIGLGALGGAAGGYLGAGGGIGSLLGGSGSGASGAAGAAGAAATNTPLGAPTGGAAQAAMAARMAAGDSPAMIGAGTLPQAAASSPSLMGLLKTGGYAGLGASLGSSLAPPPSSNTPPTFGAPMGPVNPNAMIGGRPAVSAPNFAGYNPYSAVTSGSPYSFYG